MHFGTQCLRFSFQLLYTNVFDTLKFPGTTWQGFDYHHHDAGGAESRKQAAEREKMALTKSSLLRSKESRSSYSNWGNVTILPAYSAIQKQLCHLNYGLDAKCT